MISIIVCTYNREKYLGETLRRIALCDVPKEGFELIVINNNSSDGTAEICASFAEEFPEVKFHYHVEGRQGLSYARNLGLQKAKGELLVFLDDDAFVGKDYLTKTSKYLSEHPKADAWGGRISPLFENGKEPVWYCRWSASWFSVLNKGWSVKEFKDGKYPIGANMGFRRSAVEKVGEFNTTLGRCGGNLIGGEEKDYFNRLKENGLRVFYFPEIMVQHVIPASRTTVDYIIRYGRGIGESERLRCKANGTYAKKLISELVKWGATLILWVWYAFTVRCTCGSMLVLFRANVTLGLLFPSSDNGKGNGSGN